MDSLLQLLRDDAALTPAQLAAMLNLPEPEVRARIEDYEKNHIILGYRAILNEERLGVETVRALIEVRITPERGGGFDRLAERIANRPTTAVVEARDIYFAVTAAGDIGPADQVSVRPEVDGRRTNERSVQCHHIEIIIEVWTKSAVARLAKDASEAFPIATNAADISACRVRYR